MKTLFFIILVSVVAVVAGCGPITTPITNPMRSSDTNNTEAVISNTTEVVTNTTQGGE